MNSYFLHLKGQSNESTFRIKLFSKIVLIFLQGGERIFFLVSAITGAVVIVSLIQGTFILDSSNIFRLITYLVFELLATFIYKYKQVYYTRANNLWWEFDTAEYKDDNEIPKLKWDLLNKLLTKFLSQLLDYYVYTQYIIIFFVSIYIVLITSSFVLPLFSWMTINFIFYFLIVRIKKILISYKNSIINNSIQPKYIQVFNHVLFKSKFITLNKLKLLISPFCILSLAVSLFFFVPFAKVEISETLTALFALRQILASIRIIELAFMTEDRK